MKLNQRRSKAESSGGEVPQNTVRKLQDTLSWRRRILPAMEETTENHPPFKEELGGRKPERRKRCATDNSRRGSKTVVSGTTSDAARGARSAALEHQ